MTYRYSELVEAARSSYLRYVFLEDFVKSFEYLTKDQISSIINLMKINLKESRYTSNSIATVESLIVVYDDSKTADKSVTADRKDEILSILGSIQVQGLDNITKLSKAIELINKL